MSRLSVAISVIFTQICLVRDHICDVFLLGPTGLVLMDSRTQTHAPASCDVTMPSPWECHYARNSDLVKLSCQEDMRLPPPTVFKSILHWMTPH